MLIVGDGIREGVENIVDFVQRHSGLHFTLALVEAALYRDTANRIIVQPRCLARTEVLQRLVFGEAQVQPEPDDEDQPLSDHQQENVRFWTAVLRDFAFSDVAVEVPKVGRSASLYVNVPNPGFGNEGLWFAGYLFRQTRHVGCYMTYRKGIDHAERIFEGLRAELDALRTDLGDDLRDWENAAGRPRIGFWRETELPFPPEDSDGDEFDNAVAWMRDRLDRLVSTLGPKVRRLLRPEA